jgi:DNA-binding NtrC family response regulator
MCKLKKNIFVIDRDRLVCKIIKLFLENTGRYRVKYATDIPTGIVSAMSKRVALILLDERVETAEGFNLMDHMQSRMKRPVPLLSTEAVIDRTRLKIAHTELNTLFNISILKRIDALVK